MNKILLKSVVVLLLLQYSIVLTNELELNNSEISLNFLENLDNWEVPKDIQSFRYYLSGVDEDCRPIWIVDTGKWNVRKAVELGHEGKQALAKYLTQFVQNVRKSYSVNETGCGTSEQFVLILDMEEFDYQQLFSPATVAFFLRMLEAMVPVVIRALHSGYIINANVAAEALINIGKPILGSILERIDVYGSNKPVWLPKLLRKLPQDQLPQKYGGSRNYVPLKTFG